jgi:hypothetical protein
MKIFLLVLLSFMLFFSDFALAKKRRRRSQGPPTAQDAYDFSFPRFETKCKFKDKEFTVQIRSKNSQISKDENNLGSAFFFIVDGNKISVSPGVDSELKLLPSAASEGSLCENFTAVEFSVGRLLFVLKSSKSAEAHDWIGVIWDTKSHKIVEHKKDLTKVKHLSYNSTTTQYQINP